MIWKTTLAFLFSFLSFFAVNAQNSTAFELNEYLSLNAINKSSVKPKSSQSPSTPLQVLGNDLVSMVIKEKGKIKVFSEQPPIKAVLFCNSFQTLGNLSDQEACDSYFLPAFCDPIFLKFKTKFI